MTVTMSIFTLEIPVYKGILRIEIQQEQEALMNYDGKYYVTFVMGSGCGVYELQYDFEWLAD